MALPGFVGLLIKDVATKALGQVFEGGGGDSGKVEKALTRLVNKGLLKLPEDLKKLTGDPDEDDSILGRVRAAITKFKKGLPGLGSTGLLSDALIEQIMLPGCLGNLVQNKSRTTTSLPNDGDPTRIRYWVDFSKLPEKIENQPTIEIIRQAWGEWIQHIKVNVMEIKSKDAKSGKVKWNIKILGRKMDGAGGDLADAHTGPPGRFKMELRFDTSEAWTVKKFRYTAVHEMGHLLGLKHIAAPDHIMSSHRQPDLKHPTTVGPDSDVQRLLALQVDDETYWEPRGASPAFDSRFDDFKKKGLPIIGEGAIG